MSGNRYNNATWDLVGGPPTWDHAKIALLMDIRDELKRMNNILGRVNFIDIQNKLERIAVNTSESRRKAVK